MVTAPFLSMISGPEIQDKILLAVRKRQMSGWVGELVDGWRKKL